MAANGYKIAVMSIRRHSSPETLTLIALIAPFFCSPQHQQVDKTTTISSFTAKRHHKGDASLADCSFFTFLVCELGRVAAVTGGKHCCSLL